MIFHDFWWFLDAPRQFLMVPSPSCLSDSFWISFFLADSLICLDIHQVMHIKYTLLLPFQTRFACIFLFWPLDFPWFSLFPLAASPRKYWFSLLRWWFYWLEWWFWDDFRLILSVFDGFLRWFWWILMIFQDFECFRMFLIWIMNRYDVMECFRISYDQITNSFT